MTQRLPCDRCGDSIYPDTATRNGGLCMPCKGGYRESIETSKRQREEEKRHLQSAEYLYWRGLVRRVHDEHATGRI